MRKTLPPSFTDGWSGRRCRRWPIRFPRVFSWHACPWIYLRMREGIASFGSIEPDPVTYVGFRSNTDVSDLNQEAGEARLLSLERVYCLEAYLFLSALK